MTTLHDNALFGLTYYEWLKAIAVGSTTAAMLWALRQLLVSRLKGAAATESWVDDFFLLIARKT